MTASIPSRRLLVTIAAAVSVLLAACFEKEEPTCEYWVPKLTSAAKSEKALAMVEELKCKDALPTLEKLFDEGHSRDKIIRIVKQVDDRDAGAAILKKALKNRKTAKLAAGVVKDWRLKQAQPELIEILTSPNQPGNRKEALEALLAIEDPKNIEDVLIQVAGADMNLQTPQVNGMAIEQLGKIQSKKALPTLVQAAFMRTARGGKVYQAVRQAIAQVGPESVPLLIKTIQGKNDDLVKYARDNGIFEWEYTSSPEIVQLLTDTLDQRAVKPVVANIAMNIAEPMGLSPSNSEAWRRAQINRLTTAMLGLGHVGAYGAVGELTAILKDEMADAVNQRLKSASVLDYTGSDWAQEELLSFFENTEQGLIKPPLMYPLAEAVDYQHYDRLKKAIRKPSDEIKAKLEDERVKGAFAVLDECKEDAGCLIGKIKSEKDKWQVLKAALLLMRGGGETKDVIDAALERFAKTDKGDIDLRRFLLMIVTRRGTADAGKRLIEMADQQAGDDKYWPAEMRAFGNYMIHRGDDLPKPVPKPEEDKK